MQSVSTPLNRMHEDGAWFTRATEVRLWLVRCDASLRQSAVTLVPKLEFHADNRAAWPVLLDAHTTADPGWQLRANVLAADWARRVDAFAATGVALRPVSARIHDNGLHAFRRTLADVLAALAEPLTGVCIVLAPGVVEEPRALEAALLELVADPALARARWVLLLDLDVAPPQRLLESLGDERSLSTLCEVDRDAQRRDLQSLLAAGDPDRFGTASPVGVCPPRRLDDPPALDRQQRDAALRAAGVDPALLEHGPELRSRLLGAAVAMQDGHGPAAIEHQRAACRLCAELGLVDMQVVARITLASYLSGLDRRPEARRELLAAIATAKQHAKPRPESQAHLALGLLYGLDREHAQAVASYGDAARTAEAADEPLLAIEAWRMAGHHAAQQRWSDQAVAAFREALRIADAAPEDIARGSSASEAARELAALYERRGMSAQARALHAQADALEQGEAHQDAGQ